MHSAKCHRLSLLRSTVSDCRADSITVSGWVYHVETGKVTPVI